MTMSKISTGLMLVVLAVACGDNESLESLQASGPSMAFDASTTVDGGSPIIFTQTDAASPTVADGAVADASSDATSDDGSAPCPSDGIRRPSCEKRRAFITKDATNGCLGGLSGADKVCQQAADAAGLGGVWKAFLTVSRQDAASRFQSKGPWLEVGSQALLFPNRKSLHAEPDTRITRNQFGEEVTPATYWTGSQGAGGKGFGVATCNDWTTSEGWVQGRQGVTGARDRAWVKGAKNSCAATAALLCLED
jgi:hypothetical protein